MRGESDRVAARVRELLADYGQPPAPDGDDPSAVPAAMPVAPRWQQLLTRAPVRLDPGRSGAIAVGVAVVVVALVAGWWLLSQRPHEIPVEPRDVTALSIAPTPVGTDGSSVAQATPSVSPAIVVVDVAGRVRRPGLYRLPAGSRVDDALHAAGGPLHGVDLSSLNLAARVVDGQQILVGGVPLPAPGMSVATGSDPTANQPVSLNSATAEQLESLPGVGPVLAQKIIDWRTQNGGFTSIDQLTDVSGIGDVTFAELEPLVSL